MADDLVDHVANEIVQGHAVDWAAVLGAAGSSAEREELEALRVVEQLSRRGAVAGPTGDRPTETLASSVPTRHPGVSIGVRSPGRMWGRYHLEEEIGSGGFGTVYRASEPALNLNVAIKVLRRHVSDDLLRDRLLDEGRTLAQIRHENVVRVLGVEFKGDRAGLCTEFIHGDTIENEVRQRGTFSQLQAIEVGRALCQALAAVHRAGFVHRDVKARNTMRERDTGRIVLMDFGAGRDVIEELKSTRRNVEGTAMYMAPEILAGQPASFSSDVYSLGVLLYYVLTGAYPVEAGTLEELKAAHLAGQRTPLGDRRPDLPPAFIRVVEQALSTRQKRYATPGALAKDLDEVLSARRPAWYKSVLRAAIVVAALVCSLAVLGFINTTYLHYILGLEEFTLTYSPFDYSGPLGWTVWGGRAVLGPVLLSIGALLGVTLILECERLAARQSAWVQKLERSAAVLARRWSLHKIEVLAPLAFVVSAAILLGTSWHFARLLDTLTDLRPDDLSTVPAEKVALLSPDQHNYHVQYRKAFTAGIVACVILWYPIFSVAIRTRQPWPSRAIFGGALVMMFMLVLLDFPFRLVYWIDFDEVTWQGHSCHLIGTNEDRRLLFCPELTPRRTQVAPAAELAQRHKAERSLLRFIVSTQGTPKP